MLWLIGIGLLGVVFFELALINLLKETIFREKE
jgi:hypothetical protein